ncbi:Early nodulin-like protein [Melia azedarach]|uniref:Early nodulin-like protein n=1 Tax=Melia azedarach TaxID=155640 RepID=A0ACC1Z0W5_MELAZ|nr:Early nodulin-like protein [Melia azedarach]
MANHFSKNSINVVFLFLTTFSSLHFLSVHSFEFQVGGIHGWVVPAANDSKNYNDWASENRFQVGDTIRFKYKKDSVMEVTNEDYKRCNSTHPNFFSNTGDSVFRLDHSGAFYFISGVSGHCEKGQRMIIKVMFYDDSSPEDHGHKSSAASPAAVLALRVSKLAIVQFVLLSSLASYLY